MERSMATGGAGVTSCGGDTSLRGATSSVPSLRGFMFGEGDSAFFSASNSHLQLSSAPTRDLSSSDVRESLIRVARTPETASHISAQGRKRLEEMTIDKLRFSRVQMAGRGKEVQLIRSFFVTTPSQKNGEQSSSLSRSTSSSPQQDSSSSSSWTTRIMLLGGSAGTGKSRLVREALQPLVHSQQLPQCYLLQGKYDLQKGDKPYHGIVMCCEDLCEQLIARLSSVEIRRLQATFQLELGSEASVLASIIPGLLPIIGADIFEGQQEAGEETEETLVRQKEETQVQQRGRYSSSVKGYYMEAKLRFHNAFRRFLRVICRQFRVMFFIDDLQWCDASSFELLENFLKDHQNSNLVVVGTFRPEDVDDQHGLMHLRRMCEAGSHIATLFMDIGNLTVEATKSIIMELLSVDNRDNALALAQCVHSKTRGNAFFTVQFLKSLHKQQLLKFNYGSLVWTWNIQEIEDKTSATDNVADLMSSKLETLSPHAREILPLMASLGSIFHMDLFLMTMKHLRATVSKRGTDSQEQPVPPRDIDADILNICVEEGLIEPCRKDDSYRWIHDKVEEAALALIPMEDLEAFQFDLAWSLLEQMNELQVQKYAFVLVYLFRSAYHRLEPDDQKRVTIARLKMESGRQAYQASAFLQAAYELRLGIRLLSSQSWQTDYDLCLELYSTAAEANMCIGDLDAVDQYVRTILRETMGKPLIDGRRAYNAQVRSLMANGRLDEAISVILNVLSKLGVKFPRVGAVFVMILKLVRAKRKVKTMTETLTSLPSMTDEMKAWAIFLLDRLVVCWYQKSNPTLPLAVLKALDISLQAGISEGTPSIVATTGMLCYVGLQDPEAGKLYALQALELVNKLETNRCKSHTHFVAYHFVLHQTTPIEELKKGLLQGYKSGMASGDSEFACWCMSAYLEHSFNSGSLLESLIRDSKVYVEEAREVQQLTPEFVMTCIWQMMLNLRGGSTDPLVLTGEAMNEDEWLNDHVMDDLQLVRFQVHVAVIMGAYEHATELILRHKIDRRSVEEAFPGIFGIAPLYFHCAIAAASMARQSSKKSRFYRRLTRKFGRQITLWSKKGNPNVTHHAALVNAEIADLSGQSELADELFQKAILLAARRGFRQDRALAHERFGDFFLRNNDRTSATHHYDEAISVHREWGALAKVQDLLDEHRDFLSLPNVIAFTSPIAEV